MFHADTVEAGDAASRAHWAAARAGYSVTPLESPTVSGLLTEKERRLRGGRGVYGLPPRDAREERVAVPTREVVCYECGQRSRIPVAALSAHCVHCRAHLTTADFILKPGSRRLTIRTLGDVTLPANVELSRLSITCRNLTINGRGEGTMRCSGVLTMRGAARLTGQVQAGRLCVAAGAEAQASPGISAESAEVEGKISARLHIKDILHIGKGGCVVGDCHCPSLSIAPGGLHEGDWLRCAPTR